MWEIDEKINDLIEQIVGGPDVVKINAEDAGLDCRSGTVYISVQNDFIASASIGSIEYYGGFEYIDSEYTTSLGHIKFYSGETSRVRNAIEYYIENTENKNNNQEEQGEETC
jgi:hypothetical protein